MTVQLVHPQRAALEAFGLGKLDDADAALVEQHLAECPACCETLLELQDDTFIELVRGVEQPSATQTDLRLGPKVAGTLCAPSAASERIGDSADGARSVPATLASAAAPSLPPELIDHPRYRVLALLGCGGMGEVYRAEHRLMNRPVALKVVHRGLMKNAHAVERFRREVQSAARLSHPNIVAAYDAEQAGDLHFLAMEYVEGIDLAQLVNHRGPLPAAEACEYIRQAAEGLQHAHQRGMIHRDIKPQNLMLVGERRGVSPTCSRRGQESGVRGQEPGVRGQGFEVRKQESGVTPVVKILDFGLARFAAEADASELPPTDSRQPITDNPPRLTSLGATMGTPDYIAPEQSRCARNADIRSDIYSLGCTLYFLLAGRPPFPEGSAHEKLEAHATRQPQPLSELRDDLPLGLEAVLEKMLAKDPRERYQTPQEVAAALDKVAGTLRVLSAAPEWSGDSADGTRSVPATLGLLRSAPVARSHRRVATLLALAVALFALFGAVFYVRLGETTVKFEIEDPALAVRFHEQEITIDHDGQPLRITPGQKQTFTVTHGGLEAQTTSFTLRKGEKVVLTVSVQSGQITVDPSNNLKLETTPRAKERPTPGVVPEKQGNQKPAIPFILEPAATFTGKRTEISNGVKTMAATADRAKIFTGHSSRGEGIVAAVWDAQTRQEIAAWDDPVIGSVAPGALAVTPDGRLVAAASALQGGNTVHIWNGASGDVVREIALAGAPQKAFALSPDGQRLLVASDKGVTYDAGQKFEHGLGPAVSLWDVETGGEVSNFEVPSFLVATDREDVTIWPSDAVFSPGGDRLAVAGSTTFEEDPRTEGKRKGISKQVGWVFVWDMHTGKLLSRQPQVEAPVAAVAFTPDGKRLVTGHVGENRPGCALRIWETTDYRLVRTISADSEEREFAASLDVSPDGRLAVTVSRLGTIRVWDLIAGSVIAHRAGLPFDYEAFGHRSPAGSPKREGYAIFRSDSRSFVTGGEEGLKLWRLPEGIVDDDDASASVEVDNASKKTNAALGEPRKAVAGEQVGGSTSVTCFALAADRRTAFMGLGGSVVAKWDLNERRQVASWKVGLAAPTVLAASLDGGRLAVGAFAASKIEVWDAGRPQLTAALPGHNAFLRTMAVSPDGRMLVSGAMHGPDVVGRNPTITPDRVLRAWDLQTGEERELTAVPELLASPGEYDRVDVDAVRFSPSGRLLVAVGDVMHQNPEGGLKEIEDFGFVWDWATGVLLRRLERVKTHATAVAFSPDERLLVTGHAGYNAEHTVLRVWEVETGGLVREMRGHIVPVLAVDVSPDGRLAASVDASGSLRVWRLADGREVMYIEGISPRDVGRAHSEAPRFAAAFLADGRTLVTVGNEGIKFWLLSEAALSHRQADADAANEQAAEFDELVKIAEETQQRVQSQYEAGVTTRAECVQAAAEVVEAKLLRAQHKNEAMEVVGLLKELVMLREFGVSDARGEVEAGVAPATQLGNAQKQLVDAKIRLKQAQAKIAPADPAEEAEAPESQHRSRPEEGDATRLWAKTEVLSLRTVVPEALRRAAPGLRARIEEILTKDNNFRLEENAPATLSIDYHVELLEDADKALRFTYSVEVKLTVADDEGKTVELWRSPKASKTATRAGLIDEMRDEAATSVRRMLNERKRTLGGL